MLPRNIARQSGARTQQYFYRPRMEYDRGRGVCFPRCLSINTGGGGGKGLPHLHPIILPTTGTMSFQGEYPSHWSQVPSGGYPSPRWGYPSRRGYPSPRWGYPSLRQGVPSSRQGAHQSQVGGTPDRTGVPPTPSRTVYAWTGYTAEDCFVFIIINFLEDAGPFCGPLITLF